VLNPLLVALDRFWIGSFLGVRAVAHYAVPYQITEKLTLLPSALASAAFANFAQLDFVQSIRFATRLLRKLMLWTTPLAVVGVFLIHPFLALWISPDFAGQSRHVGEILVLAFWVNGLAQVPYYLLQARGRPQVSAKCHLWELVPYVVVLYLGLKWGGLIGVALAVLARVVADFLLLASFSGVLPLLARSMLVPLLWVMVAFAVVSTVNMQDGVGSLLMIVYPLAAGAWAAWEWRKIKDKTD
jgi:O-antigen/teichoic acid export membrane protein